MNRDSAATGPPSAATEGLAARYVRHPMPPEFHSNRPTSGWVFGNLAANRATGLEFGLYWGVHIEFEPLTHMGDKVSKSVLCEWVRSPARTWRDLHGLNVSTESMPEMEGSYYVNGHHPAHHVQLSLAALPGASFQVEFSMRVNYTQWDAEGNDPDLRVASVCEASFEGVWIRQEGIDRTVRTSSEVMAFAGRFLDVADFDVIDRNNGSWLLGPGSNKSER